MTAQLLKAKEAGADTVLTCRHRPRAGADRQRNGQAGLEGADGRLVDAPDGQRHRQRRSLAAKARACCRSSSRSRRRPSASRSSPTYPATFNPKNSRIDSPVSAAQGYDSVYLLAAAIKQAGATDGPKVKAALEDLKTPIDGVATTYNKLLSKGDHDVLITAEHPGVRRGQGPARGLRLSGRPEEGVRDSPEGRQREGRPRGQEALAPNPIRSRCGAGQPGRGGFVSMPPWKS